MKPAPVVVEQTYSAPVERVWKALTDKDQMRQWYFDIAEFKLEPGFEFSFTAGDDKVQYVHLCQIKEVIPQKKLSYSWRYRDYPGDSLVIFELFAEGDDKTTVRVTHEGVESFPADNPAFARKNFNTGWTEILTKMLPDFLGKNPA